MPWRPSSPSLGQSWRGNSSLRSISAARGAISALVKALTASRICSAVSPRPRSSIGYWFDSMVGLRDHAYHSHCCRIYSGSPRRSVSEPQGGKAEKRKKADHIGDRRHEDAGGDRGIDVEPIKRKGDQDAGQGRSEEIDDHGRPDDKTQQARA